MNRIALAFFLSVSWVSCTQKELLRIPPKTLFALYAVEECPGAKDYDMETGRDRYCVVGTPLLDLSHVQHAEIAPPEFFPGYRIKLTLTEEGKAEFAKVTLAHLNKHLGVVLKGSLRSVPLVKNKITSGILFAEGVGEQEARIIASEINHAVQERQTAEKQNLLK